eukprot:1159912-Pelagomonas_calceolata.AAC.3
MLWSGLRKNNPETVAFIRTSSSPFYLLIKSLVTPLALAMLAWLDTPDLYHACMHAWTNPTSSVDVFLQAGFLEAWSIGGAVTEAGESCVHSMAQIKPEGDEVSGRGKRTSEERRVSCMLAFLHGGHVR